MSISSKKQAFFLSIWTLFSRILGLFRDHFMAVSFGNGMIASAFSVAYRFPNMFRNLLAEGSLAQAFLPIYFTSFKKSRESAKQMSGAVLSILFIFLFVIFCFIFFTSPLFVPFLVGKQQPYSSLVVELTKILFFFIVTSSLTSIFASIANSQQKFFVPSLSPILLNLIYLFSFLVCFPFIADSQKRIFFLSYAILFGGFLQLCLQGFYVFKLDLFPKINFFWKHPAIKQLSTLLLPAVIGSSFYQFSLLVDIFLANYIQNQNPEIRAVVSLDYSQRLIQLPTGVIGVAIATTILPHLVKLLQNEQKKNLSNEFLSSLTFSNFLTFPCMIGFLFLPELILNSIYFGGKWDIKATQNTVTPLMIYSLAIPFYSLNKILISSYLSFKNTKTPLKIQSIAFCVNIFCNFLLISYLKQNGIAVASVISSIFNFFLLMIFFVKKYKIEFSPLSYIKKQTPILISCLLMSCFIFWTKTTYYEILFSKIEGFLSFTNSCRVIIALFIFLSCFIYFSTSFLLKAEEIRFLFYKKK